jgi:hypothetical protein
MMTSIPLGSITSTEAGLLSSSVPLTDVEASYECVPGVVSVIVREAEPPGPVAALPSDFDPLPPETLIGWLDTGLPSGLTREAVTTNGSPTTAVEGALRVSAGFSCAAVPVTGTTLTEIGSLA